MFYRFEVAHRDLAVDPRSVTLGSKQWIDIFWVKLPDEPREKVETAAREILLDSFLHVQSFEHKFEGSGCERTLHSGMTDNRARTFKEALLLFFPHARESLEVLSGDLLIFDKAIDLKSVESAWVNPWIQNLKKYEAGTLRDLNRYQSDVITKVFHKYPESPPQIEKIRLAGLSDVELVKLSEQRLLALSLSEMRTLQRHYQELNRDCTDVELEIFAQSWSEHCKHKIFAAHVNYEGPDAGRGLEIPKKTKSLFKTTISKTTEENSKPWLLSVFKDNAGIVKFTDDDAICMKVETHNSPSALDPFGGAITGIVGVNRDILGTGIGAKPIFNTNVFCVGPIPFTKKLPHKIHAPVDLLEGVRKGVEEGGNQSGIPTVNGAVCFDESYLGKPLIFVGSGGIIPTRILGRASEEKAASIGSRIYMVGGRIGKDGIHGATFSSLALDDDTPTSVVQLGDPITQRRMTDFLIEARDLGLIEALTDNGAGGLSSSVGEIATLTGGARIDVSLAKTKYPGMAPWERTVSESQERMTMIVRTDKKNEFEKLAELCEVEISDIGEMTYDGYFHVLFRDETVAKVSLQFLHEGLPALDLNATFQAKVFEKREGLVPPAVPVVLKQILSQPNIASKEWIIRQYDHEVQGCSVIKPLQTKEGHSSPNSASVSRIRVDSDVGFVVSCGLQPELSKYDPYLMAEAAVDEAVRNALCSGGEYSSENPEKIFALIDNFCWPDPTKKTEVMGALVRACYGMRNAAMKLGLPFISGKDSMKNDYKGEVEISVVPTLLISALSRISDVKHSRSSDFKASGDVIYLLGSNQTSLAYTEWMKLGFAYSEGSKPTSANWDLAKILYNWLGSDRSRVLKSLQDLSEGGLLVALSECLFTHQLGCNLNLSEMELASHEFNFGEGMHRFIASVAPENQLSIEGEWKKLEIPFQRIGKVIAEPILRSQLWNISISELEQAWRRVPR